MLTEKNWRSEAVIFLCGLQLMCLCCGTLLVVLLHKHGLAAFKLPEGNEDAMGNGALVVSTLSFQGATWVLIAAFLWFYQLDWREFFGLRDPRLRRALGWAALAVVVLLPVLAGLDSLCTKILDHFGHKAGDELAVQLVESHPSFWGRLYMGAFAVVLAPVAEEFLFRGMLFPFVKQLGYRRTAWLGVSLLFALIHGDAAAFLPLFVLALALTWLYAKTGNLLAPITAHALFNAANLVWIINAPAS